MRLDNAIKKVIKELPWCLVYDYGSRIYVRNPNGDYHGSFAAYNGTEECAHNFHVYYKTNDTDIMTDYFDGYFVDNCKQFIEAIKE